jgi:hypothetical protein
MVTVRISSNVGSGYATGPTAKGSASKGSDPIARPSDIDQMNGKKRADGLGKKKSEQSLPKIYPRIFFENGARQPFPDML